MHFDLVDRVVELSAQHIITLKLVSGAEEYLQDHFPTFPVLPGVMMLEAMVQAGRRLLETHPSAAPDRPLVLGRVRALKYGKFVKPGSTLRVRVDLTKDLGGGEFDCRGEAVLLDPSAEPTAEPPTAVSGRLTFRPARLAAAPGPVNGG
ncbi:MAG: beta-hydroxyacyl-ACP dehydratase [Phycisphaerales bacterium]|nr:beta-hydroxyacyl-ACP dehydratase [Phycisphaerales bacterium]